MSVISHHQSSSVTRYRDTWATRGKQRVHLCVIDVRKERVCLVSRVCMSDMRKYMCAHICVIDTYVQCHTHACLFGGKPQTNKCVANNEYISSLLCLSHIPDAICTACVSSVTYTLEMAYALHVCHESVSCSSAALG